jgi:hypothetical protein
MVMFLGEASCSMQRMDNGRNFYSALNGTLKGNFKIRSGESNRGPHH